MAFYKTQFPGLLVFEPSVFEDNRGYFFESYNERTFAKENIDLRFVQDNQSSSSYGVVRGLHYQLNPHGLPTMKWGLQLPVPYLLQFFHYYQ